MNNNNYSLIYKLIIIPLGHKMCLGQRLALLECKYLFVRLLQKYEISNAKEPNYKLQSFRGFTNVVGLTVNFKGRA